MGAGKRAWLLRGAIAGVAIVVAIVAWAASRDNGGESAASTATPPRIVSPRELANAAAVIGHPIYWAGPMQGTRLELSEESDGNVQVRYLMGAAEPGEPSGRFLVIGSYPLADPEAAIAKVGRQLGSYELEGAGGRRVVVSARRPTSAYFAAPDNRVQVEVYDPSPKRALNLAASQRVRPVD